MAEGMAAGDGNLRRVPAPGGGPPGRSRRATVVAAVVGIVLALLFGWPLAEGVRGAFVGPDGAFTFAYIAGVFRNPVYLDGFRNALALAVLAALAATVVGVALAMLLDRCDFPGKRWLGALVPLPLLIPPFVGAIGIKQLLGPSGAVNALLIHLGVMSAERPVDWLGPGPLRFAAVVALTALHLYPLVTFNVQAALMAVNVEMEEAAASLGCRGFRRFRKITLPTILPSLFGASSIVLVWGLTELGVPLLCDFSRITSVQIFAGLKDIGRNPFVYALVVVILAASAILYLGTRALIGRTPRAVGARTSRRRRPQRLSPLAGALAALALAAVVGAAALPNIAVALLSFARDWYGTVVPAGLTLDHVRAAASHDMVVPSIGNSLRYVTLSTAFDLVLGLAIGGLVVRTRSRAAALIDAAAMLPLAVPGLVMAFGYLAISREGRPLAFLNPARDPTALLVIAYGVRRLPFVVRSVAAGLTQISVTLEEAASSLGAGPVKTFLRITLPLLAPHLLAGGVFAFALSMLEVSDSLVLAQRPATYPITKAIYDLFQLLGDGRQVAAALGLWAMLFLIASIALARALVGRKLGNLFRF